MVGRGGLGSGKWWGHPEGGLRGNEMAGGVLRGQGGCREGSCGSLRCVSLGQRGQQARGGAVGWAGGLAAQQGEGDNEAWVQEGVGGEPHGPWGADVLPGPRGEPWSGASAAPSGEHLLW